MGHARTHSLPRLVSFIQPDEPLQEHILQADTTLVGQCLRRHSPPYRSHDQPLLLKHNALPLEGPGRRVECANGSAERAARREQQRKADICHAGDGLTLVWFQYKVISRRCHFSRGRSFRSTNPTSESIGILHTPQRVAAEPILCSWAYTRIWRCVI